MNFKIPDTITITIKKQDVLRFLDILNEALHQLLYLLLVWKVL